MTLKQKTLKGLTWSVVDNFANHGLSFVIGIILARLLSPQEFGLIGMLTIFLALSQVFVDSGFTQALIRKQDCTNQDYSTVFYFNLIVGLFVYAVLQLSAGIIADFYNEPRLVSLVQVLGLSLVITSAGLIQRIILTKRIDFRKQARISVVASILSGVVGIWMAVAGFGVWSLVWKTLTLNLCTTGLLWLGAMWRPGLHFNFDSFREMFGFGSKLLASGIIGIASENIYLLVIGKVFSAQALGYYTRADQFARLPAMNLNSVIQRVSYPVMSTLQDDPARLKSAYRNFIKSTMLLSFTLMIGLAAVAEPLVLVMVGEKWRPCIPFMQMLCFVGMLYPLHALNLNMLKVKGRSDLFLRLSIIKQIFIIPTVILGISIGIKAMIFGMMANSIIAYFLNSYWSGTMVNYHFKEQLRDIAPCFLVALFMGVVVYVVGIFLPFHPGMTLLLQILTGTAVFFVLAWLTKLSAFMALHKIVMERMNKKARQTF